MNDLSLHFLQDVYDAEKRALRSLQKMGRAASNENLKQVFLKHRDQSQEQITRLEQVFELTTGKRPRGKTCAAMTGLVTEVEEAIGEGEKGPVLDAALIACSQAILHYEIARYGAMTAWARQMGKDEVAELLHTTLEEDKQYDQMLAEMAKGEIDPSVPQEDEEAEVGGHEAEPEPAPPRATRGRKPAASPPAAAPRAAAKSTKTAPKSAAKPAEPEPEPEPAPAAAKRGRKPASPPPEPEAAPAPKRRGRKPKN